MYSIGPSENVKSAEIILPDTKDYHENFRSKNNYLLKAGGSHIEIYVRYHENIHQLAYDTSLNTLKISKTMNKIFNANNVFQSTFTMEIDPINNKLIYFTNQKTQKGAFTLED